MEEITELSSQAALEGGEADRGGLIEYGRRRGGKG